MNVNIQNEPSKIESVPVIAKNRCQADRFKEAAVFVRPQNFKGRCKSLLRIALAAILATLIPIAATLIPIAGAQAQASCPPSTAGAETSTETAGTNRKCTNSGSNTVDGDTGDGNSGDATNPSDGSSDGDGGDAATPATPATPAVGDGNTGDEPDDGVTGDTGDAATPATPAVDSGDGNSGDGNTGDGNTGDTTNPSDGDSGDTGDAATPATPAKPAVGDGNTGDEPDDGVTGDTGDAAIPATPVTPAVETGETLAASGSSSNGHLVMGLLAMLMHYGLDMDESESELVHYYAFDSGSAKKRSRRTSVVSRTLGYDSGIWVRPAQSRFTSYGSSYFGAVSNRMSWDIHQSGNYFLRANISPASSVSPTGWQSSASGDTLSLTGGWQSEERRLQLGITHGRYDANAKLYDSTTKGNLLGESEFVHTSVHASAAQEFSGGPMKLSSSASLMAGQVEQAPYAAENAVMKAKVPAYRQSYTGFRLGFSAKSRNWLELSDGTSVKPHLKFTAMRTRSSASDPVQMRQSDKVGALSFHYESVLQGIPQSLNLLGIGVDVKPSGSHGVWRLGYAGMEVDGEYQHAAVAAYRMQF